MFKLFVLCSAVSFTSSDPISWVTLIISVCRRWIVADPLEFFAIATLRKAAASSRTKRIGCPGILDTTPFEQKVLVVGTRKHLNVVDGRVEENCAENAEVRPKKKGKGLHLAGRCWDVGLEGGGVRI